MLFCSNFNGTWDQYIDAFADGIPNGLNLFWYSSTKYPAVDPDHAVQELHPLQPAHTDYYYNATPGSAQRDIKAALRVAANLRAFAAASASLPAAEFGAAYRRLLVAVQNDLGSPGYAPVASERHRRGRNENRSAAIRELAFHPKP